MNSFGKGFELLSFEFSLPRTSCCISCPNCGYQIYNTILHKVSISKTLILFCCGSVIYWSYLKDPYAMISLWTSAKDLLQNGIASLFWSSSSSSFTTEQMTTTSMFVDQSNTTKILNQYYQCSKNSVHNQVIVNNCNNNEEDNCDEFSSQPNDSNDFSSLNISPLNSIGNSTVAKLDGMLNEVREIQMYVNDSCNELGWFNLQKGQLLNETDLMNTHNRHISDGDLTTSLPSLEWDLNDINMPNDDNLSFDCNQLNLDDENGKLSSFQQQQHNKSNNYSAAIHDYQNFIDSDALSHIIFNKNFEFKDEKFFRMKKQYLNLKKRLKFMSKSYHQNNINIHNNNNNGGQQLNHNNNNHNLNSYNYRKNRDSAFFEEI